MNNPSHPNAPQSPQTSPVAPANDPQESPANEQPTEQQKDVQGNQPEEAEPQRR